jgi:hypothetical protein
MALNVNPKLRNNIQFWDILELFEKCGFVQQEGNNFQLMLEISLLIGCLEDKDEQNIKNMLSNITS